MDPRVKPAGDTGKNGITMATFHFDLVSPEKLAFSGEVDQVDIPGVEGDFGVLAGHAPVIAAIRPGILTVFVGGTQEKIIVTGGVEGRIRLWNIDRPYEALDDLLEPDQIRSAAFSHYGSK